MKKIRTKIIAILTLMLICYDVAIMAFVFKSDDGDDRIITGELLITGGVKRGTIGEFVFSEDRKVSELDWQIKNCIYTGFSADLTIGKKAWFSGDFSYGLNDNTGEMEDFDWNLSGVWTNYSKHSFFLEKAFFLDLSIGWNFLLTEGFGLKPFAGIVLSDIKMSALNGYIQYPPGSEPENIYGPVVSYRQRYVIPVAGITLYYSSGIFTIELWGSLGKYGRCQAVDNHYKRNIDFYDEFENVSKREAGIAFRIDIFDRYVFRIKTAYSLIPVSKGSSYYINTATGSASSKVDGSSGAGMEITDVGLSIGLRI